jgi:hypothetical protein
MFPRPDVSGFGARCSADSIVALEDEATDTPLTEFDRQRESHRTRPNDEYRGSLYPRRRAQNFPPDCRRRVASDDLGRSTYALTPMLG